jgi:hypothetical protein
VTESRDRLRLVLAGLFVWACSLPAFVLGGPFPPEGDGRWLGIPTGLAMPLLTICLAVIALFVFNPRGTRSRTPERTCDCHDPARYREFLEATGGIVATDHRAVRAFEVPDARGRGSYYYVELTDGSVVVASRRQVDEPGDDDPGLHDSRRFPCTEFTLRRHRDEGGIVEVVCRGEALVPEAVLGPFTREEYRYGLEPEGGAVITDRSYDELKAERARPWVR